jgi:hypothetical protein
MNKLRTYEVWYSDSRSYDYGNRSTEVIAEDELDAIEKAMEEDYYFGGVLDVSEV